MPPYLHPRSGMTTSLFTTTLAVSFLVVGIPHILPCPVNPKQFADSESDNFDAAAAKRAKRLERKRLRQLENGSKSEGLSDVRGKSTNGDEDIGAISKRELARRRECPVPKPGGLIGEIMGFRKKPEDELPPARLVKVQSISSKRPKERDGGDQ